MRKRAQRAQTRKEAAHIATMKVSLEKKGTFSLKAFRPKGAESKGLSVPGRKTVGPKYRGTSIKISQPKRGIAQGLMGSKRNPKIKAVPRNAENLMRSAHRMLRKRKMFRLKRKILTGVSHNDLTKLSPIYIPRFTFIFQLPKNLLRTITFKASLILNL